MLKLFFINAIRNMRKHSGYIFLNLTGLTIGITSFLLISLFVLHELSFDRFHNNYENTYRIKIVGMMAGATLDQAVSSAPMAQALKNDYPEVIKTLRLTREGALIVRYGDIRYNEDGVLFADSTFFDVFDFRLKRGDPKTALVNPRSMILTEEYAKKYFGRDDPVGKQLSLEADTNLYTVTGVIQDIPSNSHIHFDMLGSLTSLGNLDNYWLNHSYYTYIILSDGIGKSEFEPKLRDVLLKYVGPQIKQVTGITIEDFQKAGNQFGYELEPLKDIHLKGATQYSLEPSGSLSNVYIFSVIAFLILVIAIINYINLATAKSAGRAKEVGIRKVSGSDNTGLMIQFIGESLIVVTVSFIIAYLFVMLLLPSFDLVIGKEISMSLLSVYQWILVIVFLILLVGISAGIYPAFILISFNPVEVLKGTLNPGSISKTMRGILVVFQFTVSIIIIIGAIVVYSQLNFMTSSDLGIDKKNMLVIRRSDLLASRIDAFKDQLLKIPGVQRTGNASSIPGTNYSNNVFMKDDDPSKGQYLINRGFASYGFTEALGVEIVEGRSFSSEFGTDSNAVVINETAVKSLGLKDPVGKYLVQSGRHGEFVKYQIIGIMKDFNIKSLHNKIEPVCYFFMKGNFHGYICVRLSGADIQGSIKAIESLWNDYTGNQPFQYEFFDAGFEKLYETEIKAGRIFILFAILAIFIACLGLIGLITYMTTVRTREIGIRKIYGASGQTIIGLFSREVIFLIIISSLIAYPVAWFGLRFWLNGFAERVSVNPFVFIIASIIGLAIGLISIGYQAAKASAYNPAEALRYK